MAMAFGPRWQRPGPKLFRGSVAQGMALHGEVDDLERHRAVKVSPLVRFRVLRIKRWWQKVIRSRRAWRHMALRSLRLEREHRHKQQRRQQVRNSLSTDDIEVLREAGISLEGAPPVEPIPSIPPFPFPDAPQAPKGTATQQRRPLPPPRDARGLQSGRRAHFAQTEPGSCMTDIEEVD